MLPNEPPDTGERTDLAFPLGDHGEVLSTGLTKREVFAAFALQGLLASETENYHLTPQGTAQAAVDRADLLIQALKDRPTG